MTTYILIDSNNKSILGVYTDREAAKKMMRVFRINDYDIYCQQVRINNAVPTWAEKILELEK